MPGHWVTKAAMDSRAFFVCLSRDMSKTMPTRKTTVKTIQVTNFKEK